MTKLFWLDGRQPVWGWESFVGPRSPFGDAACSKLGVPTRDSHPSPAKKARAQLANNEAHDNHSLRGRFVSSADVWEGQVSSVPSWGLV